MSRIRSITAAATAVAVPGAGGPGVAQAAFEANRPAPPAGAPAATR